MTNHLSSFGLFINFDSINLLGLPRTDNLVNWCCCWSQVVIGVDCQAIDDQKIKKEGKVKLVTF